MSLMSLICVVRIEFFQVLVTSLIKFQVDHGQHLNLNCSVVVEDFCQFYTVPKTSILYICSYNVSILVVYSNNIVYSTSKEAEKT
jgi:hypothetical protein